MTQAPAAHRRLGWITAVTAVLAVAAPAQSGSVPTEIPATLLGTFTGDAPHPHHGTVPCTLFVAPDPDDAARVLCTLRTAEGEAPGDGALRADPPGLQLRLELFPRTAHADAWADGEGGLEVESRTPGQRWTVRLARAADGIPDDAVRRVEEFDDTVARPITVARRGFDEAAGAALDRDITAWMQKKRAVGLTIAAARGNRPFDVRSYGFADFAARRPAGEDTLYRWASISKPLTAVAAMQLRDRGKIDLDADVRPLVPEFDDPGAPITARQLLAHTAGITHYRGARATPRSYDGPHPFADRILALDVFRATPLVAPPGQRYHYSTHGYALLGAVLERAAGKDYVELVQKGIAAPLQLDTLQPDYEWIAIEGRAAGYHRTPDGRVIRSPTESVAWKLPGGGWISSTADLLGFGIGMLNGRLLPRPTREAMFEAQQTADGNATRYGLGFSLRRLDGRLLPAHSGSQNKTATDLLLDPGNEVVVAVMCNTLGAPVREISALVYRALMR